MNFHLPEKFKRQTRWAYLNKGVEVGPYSASEIVELLRSREIDPDTRLVELNSRRTSPVREVGPFANLVVAIVTEQQRKRAERDFEDTRSRVIRGARLKIALFVGIGLAILAGIIVLLVVYNPFKPEEDKVIVVHEAVETVEEPRTDKQKEPESGEEEFRIHEADSGEMGGANEEQLVRSVKEEQLLALSEENLGNGDKLEGPAIAVPDPATRLVRAASKADVKAVGGGVASAAGAVTTFDFTDDEDEDESSEGLARQRLAAVVRKCVISAMHKYQDVEQIHIKAIAKLQPDGRLTGLKLKATPAKHVGDMKMCASAELMRQRVPPSGGTEKVIITTVDVSASD